MKKLLIKGCVIFLILEILFRLVIDPMYFYQVDSYTLDKTGFSFENLYGSNSKKNNVNIDYLFFGTSRIPASIDIKEIQKKSDSLVVVNAGRGYLTGAINYWGLKRLVDEKPGCLKGAKVITEFQGSGEYIYTENYNKSKYDFYPGFPHLLLPHLNFKNFLCVLRFSNCNFSERAKLFGLYVSSIYRNIPFIRQKLKEKVYSNKDSEDLVAEGGIKTDSESIEMARNIITTLAQERIHQQDTMLPFSQKELDESMISEINNLVKTNGGQLILLDMPLHTVQKEIFQTELNIKNQEIFKEWVKTNNIKVINVDDFEFSDDDFPDYGHLGEHKRGDFTNAVYDVLATNNL